MSLNHSRVSFLIQSLKKNLAFLPKRHLCGLSLAALRPVGPGAIFFGCAPLSTRGTGHPASGNGGTQHIFRARVGTVKSPAILQAAHTVHAALENAGTQAVLSWVQGASDQTPKASSPQR